MDLNSIILIGFYILILIYSIIIHEVMHGYVALWLGDSTAKYAERLNFNPLKHIDPFGSILVSLAMIFMNAGFVFGWAKPVPYNPYNLRNQKWGPLLVALGGPVSNIIVAFTAAVIAMSINIPVAVKLGILYKRDEFGNLAFNFNNWTSVSQSISHSFGSVVFELMILIIFWNVLLAVFNLIPIPPLDGSKILYSLFSLKTETMIMLEQYGFVLLLIIIIIDGMTFNIIGSVLSLFWSIFFSIAKS